MAMSGTKHLHRSSWPLSRFTPLLAVLGAELLLLLVVAYQTELDPSPTSSIMSKLMWRNGTVRPPVLLFLIMSLNLMLNHSEEYLRNWKENESVRKS